MTGQVERECGDAISLPGSGSFAFQPIVPSTLHLREEEGGDASKDREGGWPLPLKRLQLERRAGRPAPGALVKAP